MTNVNTAALREMLAKATPGEWTVHPRAETTVLAGDGYSVTSCESNFFDSGARNKAHAELTVAAVNALPTLLDNTDRLAALEAGMRGLVDRLRSDYTIMPSDEIADELAALLNRPADGGK